MRSRGNGRGHRPAEQFVAGLNDGRHVTARAIEQSGLIESAQALEAAVTEHYRRLRSAGLDPIEASAGIAGAVAGATGCLIALENVTKREGA